MATSKSNGNTKKRRPRRKRMSRILMNDDVNSFQYVIETLVASLPMCNSLRAEQIAILVHESGQCEIYSGFGPDIYLLYAKLKKSGLSIILKIYENNN